MLPVGTACDKNSTGDHFKSFDPIHEASHLFNVAGRDAIVRTKRPRAQRRAIQKKRSSFRESFPRRHRERTMSVRPLRAFARVAALSASLTVSWAASAQQELVTGALLPLTGPAASIGLDQQQGIQF